MECWVRTMKKIVFRSGYYLQKRFSTCKDHNPLQRRSEFLYYNMAMHHPPFPKKTKNKKQKTTEHPIRQLGTRWVAL